MVNKLISIRHNGGKKTQPTNSTPKNTHTHKYELIIMIKIVECVDFFLRFFIMLINQNYLDNFSICF